MRAKRASVVKVVFIPIGLQNHKKGVFGENTPAFNLADTPFLISFFQHST